MDSEEICLNKISEILNRLRLAPEDLQVDIINQALNCLYDFCENLKLENFENYRHTKVEKWLKETIKNEIEYKELKESNEIIELIDATSIVEECATEFSVDFEGGPLDDPNHWIWSDTIDLIYKIAEEYDNDTDD